MAPTAGRRVRLDDVAAAVGVSPASVSLVLRGAPGPSADTRARVLEAAQRLGYRPDRAASLLASRRSRLVGVLLDVGDPFDAQLAAQLQDAAEDRGYDVLLSTITRRRGQDRAVETLLDSRCEALVLVGPEAAPAELATLAATVPLVVLCRRVDVGGGPDVVRTADDAGTALAVEHLWGLGHTAIAYVDGGVGRIAEDRRNGYLRAMRARGLAPRVVPSDGRTGTERTGIEAAPILLAELPTAVVAFNDRTAVGLMDALARGGVDVPGDVSVVGYDDLPLARLAHIELTTVGQDIEALSAHALDAVVARLDRGAAPGPEVLLDPYLAIRRTTAAPRGASA
ncbi:LacI family DNA-binding transcriptional regulator [Pseudonocardia oroxyli]|uniref:Transcriptional regulator, LacI family n=1 Tax=Pseudonocardia oroxyli TaxID=366584 RepID=A0A1G7DYX3_PSEOR|nr:LacI family DNA-binding transcriptional regulator [Pseudonocardia oroxyli]SDE56689.1 transcriptional regulator, LacI family [Pseudonocardia oroxyli]